MTWKHVHSNDKNGLSRLGEITIRIMRLVAHQQLSRAEAQLRAQNIPANIARPYVASIKKLPENNFSSLSISEKAADF